MNRLSVPGDRGNDVCTGPNAYVYFWHVEQARLLKMKMKVAPGTQVTERMVQREALHGTWSELATAVKVAVYRLASKQETVGGAGGVEQRTYDTKQ